MRRFWTIAAVVALALFVLFATGCDKIVEQAAKTAVEKSTGVSVDEDDDSVTVKTDEGETTVGTDGELPEDWPDDAPVYDGKITTALTTEQGLSLTIETDDSSPDVFQWYKEQLGDEGWKIESEMTFETGGNIAASNADWTFNMTCGTDDDGTTTIIANLQEAEK